MRTARVSSTKGQLGHTLAAAGARSYLGFHLQRVNGLLDREQARQRLIQAGEDTADAVVLGVGEVEKDPADQSVGLGGIPNELGVVQLDASVMHGPTHKAGAVACIEDILHPAQVALQVLRRTDHVMLVGRGAKDFALAMGHEVHGRVEQVHRQVATFAHR